ncbi:hypothetical protein [Cypionkella sp.]|uniref:hypothetical protein n=1 Tax=Cypionkella sp. TaxID=2811411 RepID=UPI0026093824|nr:hypothetical protein [Cypionkella sp.]
MYLIFQQARAPPRMTQKVAQSRRASSCNKKSGPEQATPWNARNFHEMAVKDGIKTVEASRDVAL